MKRSLVYLLCCLSLSGLIVPPTLAASQPELNFKIYSPDAGQTKPVGGAALTPKSDDSANAQPAPDKQATQSDKSPSDSLWSTDTPQSDTNTAQPAQSSDEAQPKAQSATADTAPDMSSLSSGQADKPAEAKTTTEVASQKVLKGYIRVVPSGTKIPIIMDTGVDSDTSQEGDEFSARTGEDLNIDGNTVVPAGSIIKGRIAQLNSPKNLGRGGSVALKFDTITTPDNRQIPLVANLVAHGGVVHAKRGLKDVAMDTSVATLPALIGVGIGALASNTKSGTTGTHHIGRAQGALIGAGVGVAIGVVILAIKKGKKVDVRPGDELKIELAEDLRMPM